MSNGTGAFSNFDILAGILNPAHLEALQKDFLRKIVLTVEGNVKKVTPVRTGHLRRSITSQLISPLEARIGTNLVYAPVVHTRNPYMDIGLAASEGQIDHYAAELGGKWLDQ